MRRSSDAAAHDKRLQRAVMDRVPTGGSLLDLSVTDAAAAVGISRNTLSALLNGRAGISPEMAVRLSIAFGTSSETWMNQQTQYDLWHAEKRRKDLRISRVAA